MSQEIINKALQYNLLSPLTVDDLWSQFLQAFSYEIDNLRGRFGEIKDLYNIYKNNKNEIIRISKSFGYVPNLMINDSIYMATKETESLPYKIKLKTTYDGYYMILQQNSQLGDVFAYYYDGEKLIKAIDYEQTLINLKNSDNTLPFRGISPVKNFTLSMNIDLILLDYLDEEGNIRNDEYGLRLFSLDQQSFKPYWRLDKRYVKVPTSHLGLEYYPQNFCCGYTSSLGMGNSNISIYDTIIKMSEYYIPKSINILIDDNPLNLIVTSDNDLEYYSDADGILNPSSSYDISSGKLNLIFNEIPDGKEILVTYDINMMISGDYLNCLEFGSEYNKRCPIVPHAGVFLFSNVAEGKGSDYYSNDDEGYTIPKLKLKAITASSYNRELDISEQMMLDNGTDDEGLPIPDKENYKLDASIKWYLDSGGNEKISLVNKFKYICYGNKALPIMNEKYSKIFSYANLLFFYNLNGDDDSFFIFDSSKNKLNCDIFGNPLKVDGIIDKSLDFDGDVYAKSSKLFDVASNNNYSFGIWFNCNKSPSYAIETIFDNFVNISYDYENEKLLINSFEFDCTKNEPHFLCLNYDGLNFQLKVYIDSILTDTLNYTIPSSSSYIYIGCDDSINGKFYGIIDNLWMMNKQISEDTIKYVYNNKITIINHMGNRLGYYELADDEIYTNDDYLLVQSYTKCKDIVHEISVVNIEDSNYYTARTKYAPIANPYFTIKYKNQLHEVITLHADERGNFYREINDNETEIITGGINYDTGDWNLAKDTIKSISQKEIIRPDVDDIDTAYKITNEILHTEAEWYRNYDEPTDDSSDVIHADDYDISSHTDFEKTSVYYSNNDNSSPKIKIYAKNDDENYYVYKYNEDDDEYIKLYINMREIPTDVYDTKLFTYDGGNTLYLNLTDLLADSNRLRAFVDLGEYSSTVIYTKSIDEDLTSQPIQAYLDVNCSPSREIKKWKDIGSGSNGTCYTLGANTVYYSDLSFNSLYSLTDSSDFEQINFTPLEMPITSEETTFELNLIETVEKYSPIEAITFIEGYHDTIMDSNIVIVPASINFDYWMTVGGSTKRFIAHIDGNGNIYGENIASGGHFDYEFNLLNFSFIEPINSPIVISYDYKSSLDIDTNEQLIINYKVVDNMVVNEIGFEDENHELLAYMTFPDIQPNDINNNISAMMVINKD